MADLVQIDCSHDHAWTTAQQSDSAKVHGAVVEQLQVAAQPPQHLVPEHLQDHDDLKLPDHIANHHQPPPSFVLTGTIAPFGIDALTADFYSYHVDHTQVAYDGSVIYQMAVLRDSFHFGGLFPTFKGTFLDVVKLHDVVLTYQNRIVDISRPIGWELRTNLIFDKSYGALSDILSGFFGVPDPKFECSCSLGGFQDWHKPLSLTNFIFRGAFTDVKASPCKGVMLSRIGIELAGFPDVVYTEKGFVKCRTGCRVTVMGILHLTFPAKLIPMDLAFAIEKYKTQYRLNARLDADWDHAFGFAGLTLSQVTLQVDLDSKNPWKSLTFDMSALLHLGRTSIAITGYFSVEGNYALSAEVYRLDWEAISNLYSHFYGKKLSVPDFDFGIEYVCLTISRDNGLQLLVDGVKVGHYAAGEGSISFNSNGGTLRASLNEGNIQLNDDIVMEQAFVEVSFTRGGDEKASSFMIGGKVRWLENDIQVAAHLYTIPDDDTLHYAIYGQFTNMDEAGGFCLADHIPGLENSCFADITLQNVALVAASREDRELATMMKSPHQFKKGVQLCATVGDIEVISKAMKGTKHAFVLSMLWSPDDKTKLDISLTSLASVGLELGRGVVTGPITIHIIMDKVPRLSVVTGAKIGHQDPLDFELELDIGLLGLSGTGHLQGGWKNPMGLFPEVTVGPNLALKLAVSYVTGPSAFGFVGGMQVGKADGQLAFEVSENPSQELFYVEVRNVSLRDVVHLAGQVAKRKFEDPPNIMEFSVVKLYACPLGAEIGRLKYPAGFSFACTATLWGKHASINARASTTGLIISGHIDPFKLGPLEVSGKGGGQASFELEVSTHKQGGHINGQITIFDNSASLLCVMQLNPFLFHFEFDLDFADLFTFKVKAMPKADLLPPGDPFDSSYHLEAKFRQSERKAIAHKLVKMFDQLAKEDRQARAKEDAKIEEQKQIFEQLMNHLMEEMNQAYAAYETKKREREAEYAKQVEEDKKNVAEKQAEVDRLARELRDGITAAQKDLWDKQHDREAEIAAAEAELRNIEREWDRRVQQKHDELDEAEAKLRQTFGDVEGDLEYARSKVNSLQDEIDDLDRSISQCEDTHYWDVPSKAALPGMYAARAVEWAAKEIADSTLRAAEEVVNAGLAAAHAVVELAHGAVEVERALAKGPIAVAEAILEETKDLTHRATEVAESFLETVKESGQKLLDSAKELLKEAQEVGQKAIAAAKRGLDTLEETAEWVLYQEKVGALQAAKIGVPALMSNTQAVNAMAGKAKEAVIDVVQPMWERLFLFIDITKLEFSLDLDKAIDGCAFQGHIVGTFHKEEFTYDIEFDPADGMKLVDDTFRNLVEKFKDGLTDFIDVILQ